MNCVNLDILKSVAKNGRGHLLVYKGVFIEMLPKFLTNFSILLCVVSKPLNSSRKLIKRN